MKIFISDIKYQKIEVFWGMYEIENIDIYCKFDLARIFHHKICITAYAYKLLG